MRSLSLYLLSCSSSRLIVKGESQQNSPTIGGFLPKTNAWSTKKISFPQKIKKSDRLTDEELFPLNLNKVNQRFSCHSAWDDLLLFQTLLNKQVDRS